MESEVQVPGVNDQTAPSLGFGGKLINIFANPRKTIEELNQRPTWLVPLIISILITVAATQIAFPIIMSGQLEALRNNPNIPAEQMAAIESQFAQGAATQRIITVVTQVIGTPIFFLALAGIFYLMGTVILGGDSSYKRVFSVLVWANLILVISALVNTALIMAKGSTQVSLSLSLLLSSDAIGTKLHTFLSKFDFFVVWFLAVFALGFGYIYKFSTGKAYAAVGVLWAIWIAISVALSGVFKQFGF